MCFQHVLERKSAISWRSRFLSCLTDAVVLRCDWHSCFRAVRPVTWPQRLPYFISPFSQPLCTFCTEMNQNSRCLWRRPHKQTWAIWVFWSTLKNCVAFHQNTRLALTRNVQFLCLQIIIMIWTCHTPPVQKWSVQQKEVLGAFCLNHHWKGLRQTRWRRV